MSKVLSIRHTTWFWSFLGAVLVGIVASVVFGFGTAGSMLSTASAFVVFSVLVGLGQMLVISSGPGNIDLSIPATIALCGGIGMRVMATNDHSIVIGILAVIAAGALIGLFNYLLIRALRIPPIIATLSSSFVLQEYRLSRSSP
jgi:ribose transport system permease protein